MNERFKQIRRDFCLTQAEFGERIGLKQNSIALLESGSRNASNQVIISVCREFNVNENWLRTGEGQPYRETTSRKERIAAFFGDILRDDDESFRIRLIEALSEYNAEDWKVLEKVLNLPQPRKKSDKNEKAED